MNKFKKRKKYIEAQFDNKEVSIDDINNILHNDHPEVFEIVRNIKKEKSLLSREFEEVENIGRNVNGTNELLLKDRIRHLIFQNAELINELGRYGIKDKDWFKDVVIERKKMEKKVDKSFEFMSLKEINKVEGLLDDIDNESNKIGKENLIKELMSIIDEKHFEYKVYKEGLMKKREKLKKIENEFSASFRNLFNKTRKDLQKIGYFGDISRSKTKKAKKDVINFKRTGKKKLLVEKFDTLRALDNKKIHAPIKSVSTYYENNPEPKLTSIEKTKNYAYIDQKGNKYYSVLKTSPVQYRELDFMKEKREIWNGLFSTTKFDPNRTDLSSVLPNGPIEDVYYLIIKYNGNKNMGNNHEQYHVGMSLNLKDKDGIEATAIIRYFHKENKRRIATVMLHHL